MRRHTRAEGYALHEPTDTSFLIHVGAKVCVNILPEFRDLITPLSAEERQGLKTVLAKDRQREPIVIGCLGDEYVLLDGHTRYAVYREEQDQGSIQLSYIIIELPSREAAKLWILENQVSRRNLTDDQRAVIWTEIREARSAKVRTEQLAAARQSVSVKTSDTERPFGCKAVFKSGNRCTRGTSDGREDGYCRRHRLRIDTRASVAKEAKLPERKLRAAQEIKKVSPELAAKVRTGDLTLKQAKREANTPRATKPNKKLDTDGRYRKMYSAVSSIYGKLPPDQRETEIKSAVERILRAFC